MKMNIKPVESIQHEYALCDSEGNHVCTMSRETIRMIMDNTQSGELLCKLHKLITPKV